MMLAAAGCGSSGDGKFGTAAPDLPLGVPDMAMPGLDPASSVEDLSPFADLASTDVSMLECVQHCMVDKDCQDSCPTPVEGFYCCDPGTTMCYIPQAMSCPVRATDLGKGDGPY